MRAPTPQPRIKIRGVFSTPKYDMILNFQKVCKELYSININAEHKSQAEKNEETARKQ